MVSGAVVGAGIAGAGQAPAVSLIAQEPPIRAFYVDATGGNDANSGLAPWDAWLTLAKVNGETFDPYDVIRLQGIFREQLTPPSSGTNGRPITVESYGTGTTINGSDIITGWAVDGGSYVATVTTEPNIVFYDDVKLTENNGATNTVGASEWDWNANSLWVNVGEDPDIGILEAGQRDYGIEIDSATGLTGAGYITVRNLHLTKTNLHGLWIWKNAGQWQGIVYSYVESSWCGSSGAYSESVDGFTVRDCSFHDNQVAGFYFGGPGGGIDNLIIGRCSIYNNSSHGITYNSQNNARATNVLIDSCLIYDNGGSGISDGGVDAGRYQNNVIYGHSGVGIILNTLFAAHSPRNAAIYQNTVVQSTSQCMYVDADSTGNTARNNILRHTANNGRLISVIAGGTPGELDSDENQLYAPVGVAGHYHWRGVNYGNLADWNTNSGNDGNSDDADPLFVSEGGNDYHLQVGSPCIGVGETGLGVGDDFDNRIRGALLDRGAYEYVP